MSKASDCNPEAYDLLLDIIFSWGWRLLCMGSNQVLIPTHLARGKNFKGVCCILMFTDHGHFKELKAKIFIQNPALI